MKKRILQTTIFVLLLTSCVPRTVTVTPTPLSDEMIFNEFVGGYPLIDRLGSVSMDLRIYEHKTFYFHAFITTGNNTGYDNGFWELTGSIRMDNGKIRLIPSSEEIPLMPTVLVPVRWGERRYLIYVQKLSDFCTSVQNGVEPRSEINGDFHMKDLHWEIPVDGQPISPNGQKICP